jgi:hypothetical protein
MRSRSYGSTPQDTDRTIVASDCHALESRFALHIMDGVLDWEPVVYAFKKTYEWTLHYFRPRRSWIGRWYYPYPEAPLFATWDEFPVTEPFVWEQPRRLRIRSKTSSGSSFPRGACGVAVAGADDSRRALRRGRGFTPPLDEAVCMGM